MTGKRSKRGGAPPVDGAAVMGLEEQTEAEEEEKQKQKQKRGIQLAVLFA
jgi:hypothetical protein